MELTITRVDEQKQLVIESKATGNDGNTYTQKATCVLAEVPTGSVFAQVGCDHGSMIMYTAKYAEAGEVEEATTKERKTLKVNTDPNKGLSTTTDEESSSNTTVIIVVVAVVLVIAVVVGVVVTTKKKKN